jgi:hypothetical protein
MYYLGNSPLARYTPFETRAIGSRSDFSIGRARRLEHAGRYDAQNIGSRSCFDRVDRSHGSTIMNRMLAVAIGVALAALSSPALAQYTNPYTSGSNPYTYHPQPGEVPLTVTAPFEQHYSDAPTQPPCCSFGLPQNNPGIVNGDPGDGYHRFGTLR